MSPNLHNTLRRTNRLTMLVDLAVSAGGLVGVLIGAGLLAVVADGMFGFGQTTLTVIDFIFVGLAVAALLGVLRVVFSHRFDARRIARLIEDRLGIADSRLINAVEFAADTGMGSASLRQMAVSEGESFASTVRPPQVIDRRPIRRSLFTAGGALLALAVLYVITPSLFATVVPRYLDPSADLPPFTLVKFEITIDPAKVYVGQPATIRAKLSGPTAGDSASVVFADGQQRIRQPMVRETSGAFVLPIEKAEHSRRFYIDTVGGRSAWMDLAVLPVPIFKDVSVRYTYPAYTGWPVMDRSLDGRGVQALVGTAIAFTITSNLPLREGRLVLIEGAQPPQEVTLSPTAEPFVVTGSFELRSTSGGGEFQLGLVSKDGVPSDTTVRGKITAIADGPPQVQLLQPDLRVVAPEKFQIPVALAAYDDIGVGRVVLHHRINDGPTVDTELPLTKRGPTYATASTTLDLAQLGAKPGDTVKAFATAFDNHPSPANSAESTTFEVAVLSDEQYADLARQQYTIEQIAREAAELAERMDQLDAQREKLQKAVDELRKKAEENGGEVSPEDQKALDEIAKALEQYEKDSAKLAEDMQKRAEQPQLYEIEKPYGERLKKLAEQMKQQAAAAASAKSGLKPGSRQKLDDLAQQLQKDADAAGSQKEERRLTEHELKQMEIADRLATEADAIKSIARQQRELAEKLSALRDRRSLSADERAIADRLAVEQEGLKRELTESMKALEQAADDGAELLPKMTGMAKKLLVTMKELKITEDQQDAADAARAGHAPVAYSSADTAADKLESLIGQCNGMCNSASDDLDGCFGLKQGSGMSNALSQLGRKRGSGSGSGQGSGRGAGSQSGAGSSTGSASGDRGATLMGPHSRSFREADGKGPKAGAFGRPRDSAEDRAANAAQNFTPDARAIDGSGGGPATQGVPLQYRSMAEKYFRRLNEAK